MSDCFLILGVRMRSTKECFLAAWGFSSKLQVCRNTGVEGHALSSPRWLDFNQKQRRCTQALGSHPQKPARSPAASPGLCSGRPRSSGRPSGSASRPPPSGRWPSTSGPTWAAACRVEVRDAHRPQVSGFRSPAGFEPQKNPLVRTQQIDSGIPSRWRNQWI